MNLFRSRVIDLYSCHFRRDKSLGVESRWTHSYLCGPSSGQHDQGLTPTLPPPLTQQGNSAENDLAFLSGSGQNLALWFTTSTFRSTYICAPADAGRAVLQEGKLMSRLVVGFAEMAGSVVISQASQKKKETSNFESVMKQQSSDSNTEWQGCSNAMSGLSVLSVCLCICHAFWILRVWVFSTQYLSASIARYKQEKQVQLVTVFTYLICTRVACGFAPLLLDVTLLYCAVQSEFARIDASSTEGAN